MNSLFVTGTDTNAGKTVVTALLVCHLQNRGIDVGVMKPFATGCARVDGELQSSDALFLRAATGVSDELELINPCRWEEPLAPLVAARRAGNAGWDALSACENAYHELARRHECVVVEGVGGWLVPLQKNQGEKHTASTCSVQTNADLAARLNLECVIVARRALGTINHTLLTCRAAHENAPFRGLIFCDSVPIEEDAATQSSPEIISEISGLPIWAQIPFRDDLSPQMMRDWAREIDWRGQ